jgi:Flp pilus assembly protein TadD
MSQELFDEAIRLEDEGQKELALGVYRQLAEASPSRNVFLRLGGITKELGLLDDAEGAFRRALEIDARSALALTQLGILAIDGWNYELAESYLKRACEIKEDPARLTLLGVALRNTGKAVEAEQAYRRAIIIDPKYEEAYYNLGVLLGDKRPTEAEALLRRAIWFLVG